MTESKPLVSVVMPIHNRAQYVQPTINSVLNQTFKNFELIIVDDKSDDIIQLEKLVDEISDERLKLLKLLSKENGSIARNTGIDNAKGSYIAFIDSDDLWYPNKLESYINALEDTSNHTIFYSRINLNEKISPMKSIKSNQLISDYLFIDDEHIHTSTLFLSTSFAKQIRFDPKHIKHQDYGFLFDAESRANFKFIDKELASISADTNLVHLGRMFNPDFSIFFRDKYKNSFSKKSFSEFTVRRIISPAVREKKYIYLNLIKS